MVAGAARCVFSVHAGVLPGQPMEEHTKQWWMSSEDWDEGSETGQKRFLKLQEEASNYAKSLQHPSYFNWVRLEWMWM